MKRLIKSILPDRLVLFYHYCVAQFAALLYAWPSKKMITIGITGTKGKTSTANFIWACLMAGGIKTGFISTANIRIGENEVMNRYHMTMPGRFIIQKLMREMVKAGCKACVVETTSEGLKQFRHVGVFYDIAVFTNLTPEHLQAHGGSFEEYKKMKGKMFTALGKKHKIIGRKRVRKVIIANRDSEHASYFLQFPADKKLTYSLDAPSNCRAKNIQELTDGVSFEVGKQKYKLGVLGKFNVYNALPAILVANLLGVPDSKITRGLRELTLIPGRMEVINEGQKFTVIVDYAHEKQSIRNVLETANAMNRADGLHKKTAKTIILLGAEGGGRDAAKRPIMGELSAQLADIVIVSNVDPYEDDPTRIVEDIAVAAEAHGKVREKNLFVIEDRREGIRKALALAKPGDIVLITGKGAEQSIVIGGKSSPWDDRTVVREELRKL